MSLGNNANNIGGFSSVFNSNAINNIQPINIILPTLSGIPLVGETLTSTQGTWIGRPPITYSYVFLSTTNFVNFTVLQSGASPNYIILIGDSGKYIRTNVIATNAFGAILAVTNYILVSNGDLVNLQDYNPAKFTLVGSKISVWADQNAALSTFSQGFDPRRFNYSGGVPIAPGAGSFMQRTAGELSITVFSAYIVLQNANKTTFRGVMSGITTGSWFDLNNMWENSISRVSFQMGHTGNRIVILVYKRNGVNCECYYNNRKLILSVSSWAAQPTLIGNIMGLSWNNSWSIGGPCKSVVISSEFHTEAQTAAIVNGLYDYYNLKDDTDIDCILGVGDSNTVGTGTPSYLVGLSTATTLNYTNLGISGCFLTPLGSTPATSIYNRYISQTQTKPKKDWIILQAGTNDILGSISSANYLLYYNEIINNYVNIYGYQANRIIICSPPYQRDGANAAQLAAYNTICFNLSVTYGTLFFDLYSATLALGNSCLSDTVHLNALGQTTWQNGVFALM